MTHRTSTAERFYANTFMPATKAAETVGIVRQCLQLPVRTPTATSEQQQNVAVIQPQPGATCIPSPYYNNEQQSVVLVQPQTPIATTSVTVVASQQNNNNNDVNRHGRRSFLPEHVKIILNHPVVQQMMDSKSVDSEKLREILSKDLRDVASLYTVNQIRDRIRTAFRSRKNNNGL
jgi:hypothetical protein